MSERWQRRHWSPGPPLPPVASGGSKLAGSGIFQAPRHLPAPHADQTPACCTSQTARLRSYPLRVKTQTPSAALQRRSTPRGNCALGGSSTQVPASVRAASRQYAVVESVVCPPAAAQPPPSYAGKRVAMHSGRVAIAGSSAQAPPSGRSQPPRAFCRAPSSRKRGGTVAAAATPSASHPAMPRRSAACLRWPTVDPPRPAGFGTPARKLKSGKRKEGPDTPGPLSRMPATGLRYGVVTPGAVPLAWQVRQRRLCVSLRQRRVSPVLPVLWTEWQVPHSTWATEPSVAEA